MVRLRQAGVFVVTSKSVRTLAVALTGVRGVISVRARDGTRAGGGGLVSFIGVNGIRIYYEKRGRGPAVLFVSGATGDAGHWTAVADILAEAYTVITYDRRANSRSPRPPGWASTTIGEQADDAAALLRGLGLVPAIVFGTSAAAGILADLCLRHPRVAQGAIFHEPIFPSGVPDIGAVNAARKARIEEGMARGGPRAAMELTLRGVAGDEVYQSLDPQLRDRLLGNAGVLFGIEMAAYLGYDPAPGQLAAIQVPCAVTAGAGNRDIAAAGHWRYQAAQWLAAHLQTTVLDLPGAHMGYLGQPEHFARALRPILDGHT
jgi:pimeloyl-ACP methyl ester carboxylesterase